MEQEKIFEAYEKQAMPPQKSLKKKLEERVKEAWEMGKPIPESKYYKASKERLKSEIKELEERVKELEEKKKFFEKEHELVKKEKELKEEISRLHPDELQIAYSKIAQVLGGIQKGVREHHEKRSKVIEALKKELAKPPAWTLGKESFWEQPPKREPLTIGTGWEKPTITEETALDKWANWVRKTRGW